MLILEEKDNITDIVLKASEEKDIVLSPSEHIYYKKMYTRIFKEKTETNNLNNLSFLIDNTSKQSSEVNKVVQKIIIKTILIILFMLWMLFWSREEVDYDKIVLKDLADFDTVIQSQANGDLILNYDQADSLDLKTSHIAKKQALEREKRRERTMAQYEKDRKLREEQLKEGKKMKELERTIRKYKEIMKNDFEKVTKLEEKILSTKIEIVPPNTQNIGLSITDLSNNIIDNSYTNETDKVEIIIAQSTDSESEE